MTLETQRLILRKPEEKDLDDYMEFVNTEFVNRYNAMTPMTREKARAGFTETKDNLSAIAMELKETGKVIGMIYTNEDSLRYGVASKEFSYFLRQEEARKGYMKEAIAALIDYFFTQGKLDCVAARCFAPNIASQRLLESLGFTRDGCVRKCVKGYQNIVFDDCLYSLMREDWKK